MKSCERFVYVLYLHSKCIKDILGVYDTEKKAELDMNIFQNNYRNGASSFELFIFKHKIL